MYATFRNAPGYVHVRMFLHRLLRHVREQRMTECQAELKLSRAWLSAAQCPLAQLLHNGGPRTHLTRRPATTARRSLNLKAVQRLLVWVTLPVGLELLRGRPSTHFTRRPMTGAATTSKIVERLVDFTSGLRRRELRAFNHCIVSHPHTWGPLKVFLSFES